MNEVNSPPFSIKSIKSYLPIRGSSEVGLLEGSIQADEVGPDRLVDHQEGGVGPVAAGRVGSEDGGERLGVLHRRRRGET